jgi:NTP pyrophosphatase (non-canonical NTP hydrolase)
VRWYIAEDMEEAFQRILGVDVAQKSVHDWVRGAYGASAADDRVERGLRLLEEACEAAQVLGVEYPTAVAVVRRTFERASGDVAQELGQTMLTLFSAAECVGVDVRAALREEYERVRSKPDEYWRERYEAKVREGVAR